MLFVNSDQDSIFPMDANHRISQRLERLYSLYRVGDQIDTVVSIGDHAYRKDIRQAAYRFMNIHLREDARPIEDSEVDLVSEGSNPQFHAIPVEQLRVFPTDADLPRDQLNTTIDEHFVPLAVIPEPPADGFQKWRESLIAELRRVSFAYYPDEIPPAEVIGDSIPSNQRMRSEEGIEFRLRFASPPSEFAQRGVLLVVLNEEEADTTIEWLKALENQADRAIVFCEPRGIGATRWTRNNPPNYVERSHALLGRTVDAGRVWDVIAAARHLSAAFSKSSGDAPLSIEVVGRGSAGLIGAYAAMLCDSISAVTVVSAPTTHMNNAAPQLLNVLRVGDVPHMLGLIAPRPLTLKAVNAEEFAATRSIYAAAAASDKFSVR
jgi:hypothetical protein